MFARSLAIPLVAVMAALVLTPFVAPSGRAQFMRDYQQSLKKREAMEKSGKLPMMMAKRKRAMAKRRDALRKR